MIPTSTLFDQSTLTQLYEHDRAVQRYRRLFALFDVERTLPGDRWLRHKQRTLSLDHLHLLLGRTIQALCEEIPGLGETVAIDVKHLYAWVPRKQSPRVSHAPLQERAATHRCHR